MAQEYFNHHANRVAIEISVKLDEETQWTGTGFFVQASGELPEGPRIDCLLLISNKHVLAERCRHAADLPQQEGRERGRNFRGAGSDQDRSGRAPLHRTQ